MPRHFETPITPRSWNQISQTERVTRSRYGTGALLLEELNTVYGYYATARTLTQAEYDAYMALPPYTGEMHAAEAFLLDHPTCG